MVLPGKSIDGLVEDTGAERISTQGDPRDRGGQEVPGKEETWQLRADTVLLAAG